MFYATAFAVLSIVCIGLAFIRHPIYGVYFYLATIYVFPPARWWGSVFGDIRWALLSAVVTVLAVMFHRGKLATRPAWLSNPPAVMLSIYAVWMWLQTPWALDSTDHLDGSVRILKYLIAFWFVYRVVDSKERLRDFLFAHVLGCALLGIYAQYTGREGGRLDGVGGPGIDDSNTLSMYLVTGLIVAVGLFMTQRGWRRWVVLASMALIANGFVLANSRGAFLGLVVGGLVLAFCKARQHRRVFWAFALAGLVGLGAIVDTTFVDRMFTIQDATTRNEETDMSAQSRVELSKAQLQMFLEYPMGTGHRGTAVLSTKYLDRKWLTLDKGGDESTAARSSHNTFLTTLVEQGLPGALLYVSLTLWCLGTMLRIRALDRTGNDPELTTLGAATCAALAVVWTAGHTADYLMAEVQFWLFAALVSMLQMSVASVGAAQPVGAAAGQRTRTA